VLGRLDAYLELLGPGWHAAFGGDLANNTPYGLSAGVWTDKGSKIFKVTNSLRAGVIWANTYNRFDPASPFGGYKESGFGREGGRHGLEPYLEFD
jgi:aldehyde dehydrogenase (NAD+)